jgi:hypothetical protein
MRSAPGRRPPGRCGASRPQGARWRQPARRRPGTMHVTRGPPPVMSGKSEDRRRGAGMIGHDTPQQHPGQLGSAWWRSNRANITRRTPGSERSILARTLVDRRMGPRPIGAHVDEGPSRSWCRTRSSSPKRQSDRRARQTVSGRARRRHTTTEGLVHAAVAMRHRADAWALLRIGQRAIQVGVLRTLGRLDVGERVEGLTGWEG